MQEGTTALVLACRNNYYDCVKLLLKYGADPKAQRVVIISLASYVVSRFKELRLLKSDTFLYFFFTSIFKNSAFNF